MNHYAKAIQDLNELAGYFQDGSAETLCIIPDDATRTWHVRVGKRDLEWGNSIEEAVAKSLVKVRSSESAPSGG